jgi:hypothetical protein
MRMWTFTCVALLALVLGWSPVASRADDTKLDQATRQVESGAKAIGSGIEDTAKGVGKTVAEGAKTAGEKIKEAGHAAEPQAKSAWAHVRDGAVSFGQSVKSFFSKLIGQ